MGGTGAGGARKGTAPLLFVTATVRSRRPTPLPEGNWLAPKLRTLLERLETLSVGPQRRWTWTNQGQSLEGNRRPMGGRKLGHGTPAFAWRGPCG